MARLHRWLGTGLAGLVAGISGPLAAQSLWIPASDPVGIARSGTGVAFGQSLEASSLNPALLVTLRDASSAFLGLGMDMASAQSTLQSNSRILYTGERNRFLPSLGAAWKAGERFSFGLKLDEPFLRHAEISPESTVRFLGRKLDLKAQRLEAQAAWALRPDFSVGAGVGVARLSYTLGLSLRAQVLADPSLPPGAVLTDPALPPGTLNTCQALVEVGAEQTGSVTVPSFSLGFRWALNPRWTVAGAYQSALRGDLNLSAGQTADRPQYFANDGFATPPPTLGPAEAATLARLRFQPGSRRLALPGRASVGVRHRLNQFFTWEVDLHHVAGSGMELPSSPVMGTPSGAVETQLPGNYRSGFGVSAMGELSLGRRWTARAGASLEPALQDDGSVNPLLSGSRSAAFSAGAGYRIWGGELSVGYQFRQNKDLDSAALEGAWDSSGYRTVGTNTRVEGMGHLWSIGFKRSF